MNPRMVLSVLFTVALTGGCCFDDRDCDESFGGHRHHRDRRGGSGSRRDHDARDDCPVPPDPGAARDGSTGSTPTPGTTNPPGASTPPAQDSGAGAVECDASAPTRPLCTSNRDCASESICYRGVCRVVCPMGTDAECQRVDTALTRCGADRFCTDSAGH